MIKMFSLKILFCICLTLSSILFDSVCVNFLCQYGATGGPLVQIEFKDPSNSMDLGLGFHDEFYC